MPHIEAGDLSVEFEDGGPLRGPVVLLLHGWPDDSSSWDKVAASLQRDGFRTLAPMLRGFGGTQFRIETTFRTGNSGVLAMDAIALLDALGVERCFVAGHDWGSNIAEALAVGWPDRVARLAMLATPPRLGGTPTPPFWHAQREWYHWFMATERGARAIEADRQGFAHLHWENWSPRGWFDMATFDRVAASWDNRDWVGVTLHSYRSRWDVAPPDPRSVWLEEKIKATESLSLPTVYIQGEVDGVNPPEAAKAIASKFSGPFEFITLSGVGHFPQREAPDAVAVALARMFADISR